MLAWLSFLTKHRTAARWTALLWLLFLVYFSDSPWSLVRALLPAPRPHQDLRVVTLNCAGSAAAAREVIPYDPDIVLFQETPSRRELIALADELYGPGNHVWSGGDASIIASGPIVIVEVPQPFRDNFVHARVQIDSADVNVVSLRLYPNVVRVDLWSRACWKSHRHNREIRRRQLSKIASYLQTLPANEPTIVGGDFNVGPRDVVLRLLPQWLSDAFNVAGRGWGATIVNQWPLIRIDQIRTSQPIRPMSVVAKKTLSSDHRMVVGDFTIADLDLPAAGP